MKKDEGLEIALLSFSVFPYITVQFSGCTLDLFLPRKRYNNRDRTTGIITNRYIVLYPAVLAIKPQTIMPKNAPISMPQRNVLVAAPRRAGGI